MLSIGTSRVVHLPAALIAEWGADEESPFDPHEPMGEDEKVWVS